MNRCECGHDVDCHSYGEETLDGVNDWCDECECDKFKESQDG